MQPDANGTCIAIHLGVRSDRVSAPTPPQVGAKVEGKRPDSQLAIGAGEGSAILQHRGAPEALPSASRRDISMDSCQATLFEIGQLQHGWAGAALGIPHALLGVADVKI